MFEKPSLSFLSVLLLSSVSMSSMAGYKYSVDEMNKIITEARDSGQPWVENVAEYPFSLFKLKEFKHLSYQLDYDYAEFPTRATIKIKLSGYLDDSISGENISLTLDKKRKLMGG